MKKVLAMLSIISFMLIMTTGCGEKKLVCTMEVDANKAESITKFSDGKAISTTVKMSIEATSDEEVEQVQKMFESLTTSNEEEYIKTDISTKGRVVTMNATLKISEMTEEQIQESLRGTELTEEAMRNYYTEQGYTCQ